MRALALAALLAIASPGAADNSDPAAVLQRIEREMADVRSVKASFTEEKKLSSLAATLHIRGRVRMERPGRIAWHVDEPIRYSVLVTEQNIREWDEDTGRVREIPLARNPALKAALDQMAVWLSGRYTPLLEGYSVRVTRQSPPAIEFIPRSSNPAFSAIARIEVWFRSDLRYLDRIKIAERGGDTTQIEFRNTELNSPLTDADFEVRQGD